MTPEAKEILFDGPHRKALDDLASVVGRLANVEALGNTSRSGTNTLNMTGAVGAVGAIASGQVGTALAIGAAGLGTSVLLSRPSYAKWATRYAMLKARATSGPKAVIQPLHAHIRVLADMAKTDPALIPIVSAVTQENGLSNQEPQ